jgi:zinc protease
MKVIVDPSHAAKVVAAQVWVRVGSADERPEEAGLAHVHEHMLFKGTARRKVGEIASDVEAAGGDINAFTSFDQTVYHVTIASRELDVALDILADAVQHSAFDESELERELEVVLEELRRGKDSPSRVGAELLFANAFRAHNYGRPIIGHVETVERFTREQILSFYRKWYRPENMLLVVAGDVEPEAVFEKAAALFVSSGAAPLPDRERGVEPPQEDLRVASTRMDIQETHLNVAWPGPALAHPDTPAVDVLSVLLGAGESSRLYRRVKRDEDLVTDAYAYAYTPHEPGLIGVGAQLQGKPTRPALAALLREVLRLREAPPTVAEVEKAKTIVLSEAVYALQTVQGRARKLGYFELLAGGSDFEAVYREAVKTVTPEDVMRVARAWLHPERFTAAAVLPEGAEESFDEPAVRAALGAARAALTDGAPPPAVEAELPPEPASPPSPDLDVASLDLGVFRAELSNGATLLVQPDPAVPLVSVLATAKGGLLAEPPGRTGVSHLVSELVVRGTRRASAERIMDACDAMAGGVSGQSGRNSLGLRGEFLKETWPRGFDIFSSCLLDATFPEDELERERQNALEELAARADHPMAVAIDAFLDALYDEHPYARPAVGTEASLRALDRAAVLDAYRTQLRPDALTIAVAGDVTLEDTVARFESTIGQAKAHPDAGRFAPPAAPRPPAGVKSVEIPREKEQAQLIFGFLGLTLADERRYALEILTQVLGSQSGRLFLELRDRQSLAYSVGCFSMEGLDRGYLALHIGTHPDKLGVAEAGMRAELDRVLQSPIREDELRRAQRYLAGSYEIGLQRAGARAVTMGLNEAYGIGYDAHARHAEKIEAVTPEDVLEVARDLVRFDHMARAVVAPSALLTPRAV